MSDWDIIQNAPRDGSRIRVGHNLDPSSMVEESIFKTYGVCENGLWSCNAAFICIDNMLRWQPTHWLNENANPSG